MSQRREKCLGFWSRVFERTSQKSLYFSTDWHNLLFANYTIDPKVLTSLGPEGTKLNFHDGSCYISLISCHFLYTSVWNPIRRSGHISSGTHFSDSVIASSDVLCSLEMNHGSTFRKYQGSNKPLDGKNEVIL